MLEPSSSKMSEEEEEEEEELTYNPDDIRVKYMVPSEKVEGTEHMRSRLLFYIDKIGDPPNSHKLVLKMFCYEWKKMKELKEIDEEIDKIPASAPPDKRRMLNNKRNEVVNSIKVHKRRSSRAHKEESDML